MNDLVESNGSAAVTVPPVSAASAPMQAVESIPAEPISAPQKLSPLLLMHTPSDEFIDIGWAFIRKSAVEICGVWAEEDSDRGRTAEEAERPYLRVKGESFALTHEELLHVERCLGLKHPPTTMHDKYALLIDPDSCLNKANFGEPVFLLRAQDEFAADLVRLWANRVEEAGGDAKKIVDAREIADAMEMYPGRKVPD